MLTFKTVFDQELNELVVDRPLLKSLHIYAAEFVNKNPEHLEFFGGNLLGVHVVRFTGADRLAFVDEIMGADEYEVRARILTLPSLDPSWVRVTDVMNVGCLWLVHKIFNSGLSEADKEQGMIDTLLALHYKFFSSILAYYFRYPANRDTAQATYAALTKKYDIKRYGNWQALFEARCRDIISPTSIHYHTIQRFNDDAAIIYMVTDIQGRLRSMVKNIWREFELVRTQNAKIMSVGGTITLDGKTILRDVGRKFPPYTRYMEEIVMDRARWVVPDLVAVVASIMPTMPEALLYKTLNTVVDKSVAHDRDTSDYLNEVLLHAYAYLSTNQDAASKMGDLPKLLTTMRNLYMTARGVDPSLKKIRDLGEGLAAAATGSRNPITLAAVRTGLSLYVVVRVFAKGYYG